MTIQTGQKVVLFEEIIFEPKTGIQGEVIHVRREREGEEEDQGILE